MKGVLNQFVGVALPVPLRQAFTYRYDLDTPALVGGRVWVPFGRRRLVGVVVAIDVGKPAGVTCKDVQEAIDSQPIWHKELFKLLVWASQYYQHPIGEVMHAALPKVMGQGGTVVQTQEVFYQLGTKSDAARLERAPQQLKILHFVEQNSEVTRAQLKAAFAQYHAPLKALEKKGLIISKQRDKRSDQNATEALTPAHTLNSEQQQVVKSFEQQWGAFKCTLLNGVTGSGKTEVYFSLIDQCIQAGRQALVLFPEIALTTELLKRFERRFGQHKVVSLHSGLGEAARNGAWLAASLGEVPIILGTRLAVFTQIQDLGLIILDEEHDRSYKQQEGFRYHARSMAIMRASGLDIPILLGSATPSLETLHNVQLGRYQELRLTKRAATTTLPKIEFVDLNHYPLNEGLSQGVIAAISASYAQGKQSIVFINRRGFAPVLYCHSCQWVARCERCDAPLTQHQHQHKLNCHYCGAISQLPKNCAHCAQPTLVALGEGTQRIEAILKEIIPKARITRFDRDVMRTTKGLEQGLASVHNLETDILVGTQLLTKGHDFQNVNLVVVVNADQGLYSHDFRATEQLAAQLIQVAGRAGRSSSDAQVMIQTRHPNHPTLQAVQAHDYLQFAKAALQERKLASLPPYSHLALWRAQSPHQGKALALLQQLASIGKQLKPEQGYLFDPCKSVMEKKAGRYRAQLLVGSATRKDLNSWLNRWLGEFEKTKLSRLAKWSIDVDPLDFS